MKLFYRHSLRGATLALCGMVVSASLFLFIPNSVVYSEIAGLEIKYYLIGHEMLVVASVFGILGLVSALLGHLFVVVLALLLVGYACDFYCLRSTGNFGGIEGLRMWLLNPKQVTQHAMHFEPMLVPIMTVAVLVVTWMLVRITRRISYRSTALQYSVLAVFLGVYLTLVSTLSHMDIDSILRRDVVFHTDAFGARSPAQSFHLMRNSKTGPLLKIAADLKRKLQGDDLKAVSADRVVRHPIISWEEYKAKLTDTPRTNVIFIVVESLRPDELQSFSGSREVMPTVDRLANSGMRFLDTYSQSSHSNYSDPAIVSGQYPLRSWEGYQYPEEYEYPKVLLYDVLKQVGYRTAIISSQDENWGGMSNFFQSPNLDYFFHAANADTDLYVPSGDTFFEMFAKGRKRSGKIDDRVTVSELIRWIGENRDHPFFVYTNLQNSHSPFEIPLDFPMKYGERRLPFVLRLGNFPPDQVDLVKDRYSSALAYIDAQIARLVDALKALDLEKSTLLVITGDTGQAFYEHGFSGHASELYDEVMRVPLIFSGAKVAAGQSSVAAQHVDIAATVLSLLGLPTHPAIQGADLFSSQKDDRPRFLVCQSPVMYQFGVVAKHWKYLYAPDEGVEKLFNLETDPKEQINLLDSHVNEAKSLRKLLDEWRSVQLEYYSNPRLQESTYPPTLVP